MSKQYDAIVVGGGHNGLTTAAYLAKSGKKTLVLEARHVLGGAAATEEIYPGFKYSTCAFLCDWLSETVASDLDLAKHGLEMLPGPETVFTPMPDGRYLLLHEEVEEAQKEIEKFSKKDAKKYAEYCDLLTRLCGFVDPMLDAPAPDITDTSFSSMWQMLSAALRFRKLGKNDMYELMRLTSMSMWDFLDEWFETDVLKAALTADICGPLLGPKSPGTAFFLLGYHMGSEWGGQPRGGLGAVSEAIAKAAKGYGAEIRTEAPVARIIVKNGATTGVALESGEEISGKIVAASTDLHRTFLKLVDPAYLDPKFLRHVRNFRIHGVSAKVNLALSELPDFTCLPGDGPHLRGMVTGAPSMEYWERAYDDAKYGRFPKAPFFDMLTSSLIDPSIAPKGKHVMNLFVHYVPYHLREGTWDERREELGDLAVDLVARYAPNIKKAVLHRQVLTPLDIETIYGTTAGDMCHGEITLDQIMSMRPVPGWTRYRMPIKNLYLCGSSAHPGGGVSATPGHFAARQILKDWRGLAAA
jgi:phytoene dehydrogenase-like protein